MRQLSRFYLVVLIIVVPFVVYQMFFARADRGSEHYTAEQFLAAARMHDLARVDALCGGKTLPEARQAAQYIGEAQPPTYSFSIFEKGPQWKRADAAGASEAALYTMISGRHLVLYMNKDNTTSEWKIVKVDFAS